MKCSAIQGILLVNIHFHFGLLFGGKGKQSKGKKGKDKAGNLNYANWGSETAKRSTAVQTAVRLHLP